MSTEEGLFSRVDTLVLLQITKVTEALATLFADTPFLPRASLLIAPHPSWWSWSLGKLSAVVVR